MRESTFRLAHPRERTNIAIIITTVSPHVLQNTEYLWPEVDLLARRCQPLSDTTEGAHIDYLDAIKIL